MNLKSAMPPQFIEIVEEHIRNIERLTGIKVLFWSLRGSLDIGIYRNNSDADIVFVFISENKKYKAFHDIVGHGFDLWGWSLESVFDTLEYCIGCDKALLKKITMCYIR